MSDARPISSLRDLVDRSYTAGDAIFASVEEAKRNDIEFRVAQLNDSLADLESRFAAISGPRDNRVQGKIGYRTDTYRLSLDPDGLGTDQPINKVDASGVNLTAVSTAANVAATLIAFTIPANTLRTNGKVIRFICQGTKTGTNAAAVIEVRFASTVLSTVQIQSAALIWAIHVYYVRTASNTQDWFIEAHNSLDDRSGFYGESTQVDGSTRLDFGTDAETDTATIAFDLRNDGTGNAGDTIVQESLIVEILN